MQPFELPITYLKDKTKTDAHIIKDLSLIGRNSLYSKLGIAKNNADPFADRVVDQWSEYYTTDVTYLKETQKMIKSKQLPPPPSKVDDMIEIWDDMESYDNLNDNGAAFVTQYQYMEWDKLYFLNKNNVFLLWMSIYNMSSPVISLFVPIILMFVPLLLLKMRGLDFTLENYIELLKLTFSKHQLGALFTMDSGISIEKKGYVAISAGLYVLQIYQNIRACITFYNNISLIKHRINTTRTYISDVTNTMKSYYLHVKPYKTYKAFSDNVQAHCKCLSELNSELKQASVLKFNIKDIKSIGHLMKCYYLLYREPKYKYSLDYSFDFAGYIHNLHGFKSALNSKLLGKASFSKSKTAFKNAFYPSVDDAIPNSYNLHKNKHILITGPNAAGKTTILKATIFNIMLSQQIGFGCYKKADITPFNYIHCYINIPDTSGRDSLFQAEARRCKLILDAVTTSNKTDRHFCIFDELYSGTNPYEAIGSAKAFLNYLAKNKNVYSMITTHFVGLCEKLDTHDNIHNYHMATNCLENNFNYTYKLKQGISSIKGGVKVLHDLEYPTEIIEETKKNINDISL